MAGGDGRGRRMSIARTIGRIVLVPICWGCKWTGDVGKIGKMRHGCLWVGMVMLVMLIVGPVRKIEGAGQGIAELVARLCCYIFLRDRWVCRDEDSRRGKRASSPSGSRSDLGVFPWRLFWPLGI